MILIISENFLVFALREGPIINKDVISTDELVLKASSARLAIYVARELRSGTAVALTAVVAGNCFRKTRCGNWHLPGVQKITQTWRKSVCGSIA